MRREIRQYSFWFPFWLVVLIPSYLWILAFPINCLWDSAVLFFSLKFLKINGVRKTWGKAIVRVWLFSFLADLVGAGLLLLSGREWNNWWKEYISDPIMHNPYDNWYSLILTILAIFVTGFLSYLFYRHWVFQRIDLEQRKRRAISVALAICSAPYLFLVPAGLFEQPQQEIYCFTNHIASERAETVQIVQYMDEKETADTIIYSQVDMLIDAVNHASAGAVLPKQLAEETYSLTFLTGAKRQTTVELYFGSVQSEGLYFGYNDRYFRVLEEDEEEIRDLIDSLIQSGFSYRYIIVDQSVVSDMALEWIASDEKYDYYLSSIRSKYIVLCFENGTVLSLTEALDKGVVDIPDLIRNGLEVIPQPRDTKHSETQGGN